MSAPDTPELGDTLASAPGSLIGQRVGNFTVRGLLGKGAMGAVYLAEHHTLERRVAIKVLQPELVTNESLVNRFIDEAKAASRLGHPNLIQIFDFGHLSDGRRYTVMEFLDGRDLETALAQDGPQPASRVAAIGVQVASALEAAHQKGIVHRDLKPANIFLERGEDGHERVKVLDFGIAKLLAGADAGHTADGHIVGTPEYMAPEQAQADRDVDHRSDIYSLGCVLYELSTGRPPHTGDNVPAILIAQVQAPAEPPSRLVGSIPPELEDIIMECLAKRRQDRFQSMKQLAAALAPLAEALPPTPVRSRPLPPPTEPELAGLSTGHRNLLVALVALVVVGGVIAFFALRDQVQRAVGGAPADGGSVTELAAADAAMWGDTTEVPEDDNPFSTADEGAVATGAAIWAVKCARCHGARGEGDGEDASPEHQPRAFSEISGNSENTDVYRFTVVRIGAPEQGMPAFGDELTDADIWKLVTFIRTLTAHAGGDELDLDDRPPEATAALLELGKKLYHDKCRSCHGGRGKGDGRAAEYLGRLPADLTAAVFKLRSTPKDSIPTDWDLYRTITMGVGTGIMPGFPKLTPEERWALVAFVKTLSPRFRREEPKDVSAVPARIAPDEHSIARGMALFRRSGCPQCHGEDGRGGGPRAGELRDHRGNQIAPPDFTDRFALLSGSRPEDVYRTLWNGLAGVPMPMGQTVLSEEDAWHVINWILSLQRKE